MRVVSTLTVTATFALPKTSPLTITVQVMVAVPALIPVTVALRLLPVTVATDSLELVQTSS